MKAAASFLLIILYIYGPVFRPIGPWMDIIFFTSVLVSIYNVVLSGFSFPKITTIFLILFPLFFYLLLSIFTFPLSDGGDYFRFIFRPIRIFVTIYAGYVIVKQIYKRNSEYFASQIYMMIFLSVVFHAIIMSLQLFYPEFKDFVYKWTTSGEFRSSYDYNFRMGGLSGGSGGAVLSVVQSLGLVVLPYAYKSAGFVRKLVLIIGGTVIFFSILICGRSGIYATIISLPLGIYLSSSNKGVRFWMNSFLAILAIFVLFLSFLFFYDNYIEDKSPLYYAFQRSLDTFLVFREEGDFNDQTVDILTKHILFPDNPIIWLVGDSEHLILTQYDRTLQSDIGFIRNLWGMGLIGLLCFVFPIVYIMFKAIKLQKMYLSASLLFLISLIMIIFHFKENFLYVRMFLSIYSLVLFVLYFDIRKSHENAVF